MHAQTFKNQKRYNLDKTPIKPREHKRCDQTNGCPKYIEDSNQHKIESKVQRVNKAKPMITR